MLLKDLFMALPQFVEFRPLGYLALWWDRGDRRRRRFALDRFVELLR